MALRPNSMQQPDLVEGILKLVDKFDEKRLRELAARQIEFEEIRANLGPRNKEELWDWMKEHVGVELSRVSVCPGHQSQLDMAWELYHFEVTRVLWVMNRGGGKTSLAAWVDACQAEYLPGWSVFTIGAVKEQGTRKYDHLLPLVVEGGVIGGKELPHVIRSIATETQLRNGSKHEIANGGSPEQANGPRTPRLHRDEVEIMREDTYKQAGNIPAGRKLRDGRYAPAQILDTSTMKQAEGRVDREIQAYNLAVAEHRRPRMEVRVSCIFESARENPACRSVPEELRRDRLVELGRDPDEVCDCDTYASDVWPSDDPNLPSRTRTLEDVCQGRFFKSRGHKEFDDIQTLFLENDRETWNAEQECSEPAREGAFIEAYSEVMHGIRNYDPDPANGPIYTGTDWGGTDEHAHGWWQLLTRDVQVQSYVGDHMKIMPAGSLVLFAELFKAKIGNIELGKMVQDKEIHWIIQFPGWRVAERYPDSANRAGILDWRDQLGMPMVSRIKKDFLEELKLVRTRVGSGKFFVVIEACPWFDKSIKAWRQINGREVHDFASHHMAQFRYVEHNLHVTERRLAKAGHRIGDGPVAEESTTARAIEREAEVNAAGMRVVRVNQPMPVEQDFSEGDVAAEESPMRRDPLTMPSERAWREMTRTP